MAAPTPPTSHDEFYALQQGDIVGPFTEAELRAAVAEGRLAPTVFVQAAGLPIWRPVARVLGLAEEKGAGAVAPDWPSLRRWVWLRLRYHLDEDSVDAGVICLLLGIVALVLARWPFVFWLPWFVAAAVAGFALLRRGRALVGALLLGAIVAVPVLFALVAGPKKSPPVAAAPEPSTPPLFTPPTPAPLALGPAATPPPPAPVIDAAPPPSRATPIAAATPPPPPAAPALDVAPAPTVTPMATPAPSLAERATAFLADLAKRSPAVTPDPVEPMSAKDGAELVQRHREALLVVRGKEGTGSGFVCRSGGQAWAFTNIHVVAGMREGRLLRLDGSQVAPGAAAAAEGRDVLRVALTELPPSPFIAMEDVDTQVRIDDDVVVLGNSGGGGVVTSLPGKLTGLGPDRVEVSAEFIPGNSGSPIVHLRTGQVIGIATYLTRRYEEFSSAAAPGATPAPGPRPGESGAVVTRRFGFRLDRIAKWEPVQWTALNAEAALIEQIGTLTGDIFDFLTALRKNKPASFATETLRRPALEWLAVINRPQTSEADRLRATQGFLAQLRQMVRADVSAAEGRLRHSYFREQLRSEREVRDRLFAAFDTQAKRLAAPRMGSGN